jgi:hypothetical protein
MVSIVMGMNSIIAVQRGTSTMAGGVFEKGLTLLQ